MKSNRLAGVRILIVEDNRMLAATFVGALEYAEATVVGVIDNLEDAIAFVDARHAEIDIAMLDVDLSGVLSYPIADRLVMNEVPFIFTTGHDNGSMHVAYRHFPVCMKPFDLDRIVSAIRGVLDPGTDADSRRE